MVAATRVTVENPGSWQDWLMVIMLAFCQTLSMCDRLILGSFSVVIMRDLNIPLSQFGILSGAARR